jgi:amidophosphoribosyltransferase
MVIASESATCDVLGIEFLREVYPGEFVVLSKNTFSLLSDKLSEPFSETIKNQKPCIFEFVYFLRPDSKMNSRRAQLVRKEMGKALWREAPVEADIVISVPDSGNFAAAGVAEEARLPLEDAFFRSHYVGRTFIEPLQERREKGLRIKLNIVPELIAGKRVVVVDDSIVRSTVIKRVVQMLRHAGAKAIHVRISSPPYAFPCYYGKDTYRVKDELIAKRCGGDIEIIRQEIGADSLHYLSLGALKRAVIGASGDLTESNFCDACFSGNYHIPIA